MKPPRYLYISILSFFVFVSTQTMTAQTSLPLDSAENLVIYRGTKSIDPSSKKRSIAIIKAWASQKKMFPPMVFSVIHETKSLIILKALTEVPGPKGLHPISFKLDIVLSRKAFGYRADYFYFEDINLSLEEWLKKYESSDNKRHVKTVEMIAKGLESHVFLSIEDLKNQINK